MATDDNFMKVRADLNKNRLYCTIGGSVSTEDLKKFYTEVRFAVADLQPGFDVITDLSSIKLGHLAALPTFRKVIHYLASSQPGAVVRVMPKRNTFYRQAMNYASRSQGYVPLYVDTLEEAEELLDTKVKRNGLRFALIEKAACCRVAERRLEVTVANISTSGCALQLMRSKEAFPEIGSELRLQLTLSQSGKQQCDFEIRAMVVRHFDGGFAVMFAEEFEAEKKDLWLCLLYETERAL